MILSLFLTTAFAMPQPIVSIYDGAKETWVVEVCYSDVCKKFVTKVPKNPKEEQEIADKISSEVKRSRK